MFIKENFLKVLSEINNGNNLGEEITLVGATKTMTAEDINTAIECGLKVVAENKVQEFREKHDKLLETEQQFIGHLQTNKVKYLVGNVSLIQSVDSIPLLEEIDKTAKKKNVIQNVLIEVNIGGEESKTGFTPNAVISVIKQAKEYKGVCVKGLMAMLPKSDDNEYLQKLCLQMREIFDTLKRDDKNIQYLSVGMSKDYKIAIKCGSNMIRLGSIIFGERNYGEQNGIV